MSEPVDVRLTLRIPRGSQQALHEEARERLARREVVERVETFDIVGIRPGLNDLRVRAHATIICERGERSRAELRRTLSEAVGIETVDLLATESER